MHQTEIHHTPIIAKNGKDCGSDDSDMEGHLRKPLCFLSSVQSNSVLRPNDMPWV